MTDVQTNLLSDKSNLDLYFKMAKEALEARDVDQAIKISENGLKKAKLENNENWIQKFNSFSTQLNELNIGTDSFKISLAKENIAVLKGIGPSIADKLINSGFD